MAPQTLLIGSRDRLGWDLVSRDDYNLVKDVVALDDWLVALLQYSAGPWGALGVVDTKRAEWVEAALSHPDVERLTAISRFGSGLAVAGIMKAGGSTFSRDGEDQAAVAYWTADAP